MCFGCAVASAIAFEGSVVTSPGFSGSSAASEGPLVSGSPLRGNGHDVAASRLRAVTPIPFVNKWSADFPAAGHVLATAARTREQSRTCETGSSSVAESRRLRCRRTLVAA